MISPPDLRTTAAAVPSALPTTDVADAASHLQTARGGLDDATAALHLAARLAGDSSVAEGCRAEIAQVLGALDATGGTLDQAVTVTRSVQP